MCDLVPTLVNKNAVDFEELLELAESTDNPAKADL
jgi:hypothetical protein